MKLSWDSNPVVAGHLVLLFFPPGAFCWLQHPVRSEETRVNLETRIVFEPGLTGTSSLTQCVVHCSSLSQSDAAATSLAVLELLLNRVGRPAQLKKTARHLLQSFLKSDQFPDWIHSLGAGLGSRNAVSQHCCRMLCFVKPWLKKDLCWKGGCGYCVQCKLLVWLDF